MAGIISSKEIKPYIWISTTSLQKDKNQSNSTSRNTGQIQMHVVIADLSFKLTKISWCEMVRTSILFPSGFEEQDICVMTRCF